MKMKKLIALLLAVAVAAVAVCFAATGCGNSSSTGSTADSGTSAAADSDLEYVKNKGTLVVGVTNFEPMDYKDKDGNWTGFDAELATKFAESLGVKVEFVEIDWDNKLLELNDKNIDCVWNGMTLTDEVKSSMSCSDAYCNNAQIVVVNKDKADSIKSVDDLKGLTLAVESGSAGQEQAEANGIEFKEVSSQANAVMEAAAGTSDGAIIDSLMAAAMVGEGTGYADLTTTIQLNSEEYGVGFRQGSDLTAELNSFLKTATKDGTLEKVAETYKVQAALIK